MGQDALCLPLSACGSANLMADRLITPYLDIRFNMLHRGFKITKRPANEASIRTPEAMAEDLPRYCSEVQFHCKFQVRPKKTLNTCRMVNRSPT